MCDYNTIIVLSYNFCALLLIIPFITSCYRASYFCCTQLCYYCLLTCIIISSPILYIFILFDKQYV